MRERTIGLSILVTLVFVALTGGFIFWAIRSPDQVQHFLIRMVVVMLIIFLTILFIRYFALLWFGYLQHSESGFTEGDEVTELPPVSIIVPAFNEENVIDRAIESLLGMDYPTFEVLVVDDGSTDRTLELAQQWEGVGGDVEIRALTQRNGGKARALNAGFGKPGIPSFSAWMPTPGWSPRPSGRPCATSATPTWVRWPGM